MNIIKKTKQNSGKERKYEFRKFLNTVHQSDRRDNSVVPAQNVILIFTILKGKNISMIFRMTR
jgi:hypothetical protein